MFVASALICFDTGRICGSQSKESLKIPSSPTPSIRDSGARSRFLNGAKLGSGICECVIEAVTVWRVFLSTLAIIYMCSG